MPPGKPPPDEPPWSVVYAPGSVRFSRIHKERQTLARLYAVHRCERDSLVWLGQSLPNLMHFIGEYYSTRLFVSSSYRVARREFRHGLHRGFVITRLADANEVNALLDLAQARWLGLVLRVPDGWELLTTDEEEENAACPVRDPVSCT